MSRRSDLDLYVAVAIGSVIGASSRRAMDLVFPNARDGWPTATFIINLTGALILGIILVVARELVPDAKASDFARRFRPFVVTGILGGYTTFSTYMTDGHGLAEAGKWHLTFLYLFGSLVAGVFCVWLGMFAANSAFKLTRSPLAPEPEDATRRETEDEG